MGHITINGIPHPMSLLLDYNQHIQNEFMSIWFMDNYQLINSDERLIFDDVKDRQIDPFFVLKEEFGCYVSDEVIKEAADELEPDGDNIWVPEIDYSIYWTIPANDTDSFSIFQIGIGRIRDMLTNVHSIGDFIAQRHLTQILYANVFTTFEIFMVQVFIEKIFESNESLIQLLLKDKGEFNISPIPMIDLLRGGELFNEIIEKRKEKLKRDIHEASWHDLRKVSTRFSYIGINLDLSSSGLYGIIQKRNDIIHRNGQSINGEQMVGFGVSDIEAAIEVVLTIANRINGSECGANGEG